jgi:hypothetical protein
VNFKRVVYACSTNTRVMRVYSSWRLAGSASLLTTVLICLGVFLFWWAVSGSEVSAASTRAGTPHAEQADNWDGYPIDDYYLAVFAAEDEAGEKLPKNAALLRTLVIVLFFGTAFGWLVACGWMRRMPEVASPIRCWFHSVVHLHQRRAVATLLGVFRL